MMIERPNWVAITHSCRRWPACPNGASNVRPSPVPNPSREIEKLWTRTWDMAASEALGDCDMQLFDANAERSGPPVTEVPLRTQQQEQARRPPAPTAKQTEQRSASGPEGAADRTRSGAGLCDGRSADRVASRRRDPPRLCASLRGAGAAGDGSAAARPGYGIGAGVLRAPTGPGAGGGEVSSSRGLRRSVDRRVCPVSQPAGPLPLPARHHRYWWPPGYGPWLGGQSRYSGGYTLRPGWRRVHQRRAKAPSRASPTDRGPRGRRSVRQTPRMATNPNTAPIQNSAPMTAANARGAMARANSAKHDATTMK